jgi:N utilization substance protein B
VRESARERALRALYEADQRPTGEEVEYGTGRAGRLISGVRHEQAVLDQAIEAASINWRVDRMPPVDRAILRIALYELRHHPETSVGTIIDEAVEMAKRYSTEESGRFVNGVLATLARRERPEEMSGAVDRGG